MKTFSQCGFFFSDNSACVRLIKQTKNKNTKTRHIQQKNLSRDSDVSNPHKIAI